MIHGFRYVIYNSGGKQIHSSGGACLLLHASLAGKRMLCRSFTAWCLRAYPPLAIAFFSSVHSIPNDQVSNHCIIYLQIAKKKYSHMLCSSSQVVSFKKDIISLSIPKDGVTTADGWKITPTTHPGVNMLI